MGLNKGRQDVEIRNQAEALRDGRMYETQKRFNGEEGVQRTDAVMLPYDSLQRYKFNRDATNNLEKLAENIYENGLLSSIRVTTQKFGGKHYILAGERRWNAIGLLRERYPDDERFKFVKCEFSPAETELDMLTETMADNMDRENPTVAEFRSMIERLQRFYDSAEENGIIIKESRKKFVNKMISETGLSDRQLRRYTKLADDTIEEIQALVDEGKVTLNTTADRIAYMDKPSQKVLADLAQAGLELTDENVRAFGTSEEISSLKQQIAEKNVLIEELKNKQGRSGDDKNKTFGDGEKLKKELAEKKRLEKQIINKVGTNHTAIGKRLKEVKKRVDEFKPYIGKIILTADEKEFLKDIRGTIDEILAE